MSAASPPFQTLRKAVPEPERDEFGAIIYPSEDGLPMSYNTIHFDWITFIKLGLEIFFLDRSDVFVAGDLLWYPVEGKPDIRVGPDVFVAFGRTKGDRTSYRQWEEGGIAPQVVFEILSPGNTITEMLNKQDFYSRYGVQEYIMFNPSEDALMIWARAEDGALQQVSEPQGWRSPLMNLTFWTAGEGKLHIVLPDGSVMRSTLDIEAKRKEEEAKRKAAETLHLEEQARANRLAARLKELGIDPDGV